MAIVALTLLQPAEVLSVRPSTMHDPFVEVFKTCWKLESSCALEITADTAATEENDVVG